MDLAEPDSITAAIRQLPPEINGLDGLVLCAGLSLHTAFEAITPEEWKRVLDVNLTGAFFVLQALTPLLRDGSAVVTVASVSAQTGVAHQAHYAAAKAGLVNLTKSAARALAPRVRVNCVTPGITMTPMGQDTIDALDPDYAKNKMLLQRFATPEEIARVHRLSRQPGQQLHDRGDGGCQRGRELRVGGPRGTRCRVYGKK